MGDVIREMERLRPVYETGSLRLLTRPNARLYVALLRAAFDPLTGQMPRETLEERFARSLERLTAAGDHTPRDGETHLEAAHRIVTELTREGEGDYAWLANTHDETSHRYLYRLTTRAHRAIDALDRLEDETMTLSGAQANSIIMEIEHARMRLTVDPRERIRLLNREIKERRHEIRRILDGESDTMLDAGQVGDVIAVIHNTLRGIPVDLHELVLTERDNGDMLRRRMQSADMDVDRILASYLDDHHRSFTRSDGGRRFEDAFQVIVTDEGRRQIDDALHDIARTPYLSGEDGQAATLLDQIRAELDRIYEGIEAVRDQIRVSDEAVSRLVRQRTDTRYRTMLTRLNRLYAALGDDARRHPGDPDRPYATGTGDVRLAPLPTRPARPMTRTSPPALADVTADAAPMPDLHALVEGGGPRLRRMIALIARDPLTAGDGTVDIAAGFNRLPARERRESELVGFLGALGGVGEDGARVAWRCVSQDGAERVWLTMPVTATRDELDAILREE
ncbi:DUF3375 family protein [Bifidobacterium samirii]|uniref:Methyl-accepting chemotaxis protein n=1 Tax=Bifidobacterium samirii TaxID=2306974 RepID=A0A430FTW2_9BIFI|nr:DUF3375 family protein [Bifidobacterium samirii]RSX56268.1 methyl-accepting chemotaxis protein [Bifidobacterium samirii]